MTAEEDGLAIAEVAGRSGVPASTLRYYETIGLLPDPPRSSGRRRYDPSVLDRLAVITAGRRAGFTLAEVGELLDGMSDGCTAAESWRALAARKLPEIEDLLSRFEAMRRLLQSVASCACLDVAECAALLRGSSDAAATGAQAPAVSRRGVKRRAPGAVSGTTGRTGGTGATRS